MESPVSQRALVVGGGIAGTAVALLLKQKGWQPIILEKVANVGPSGLALVVQSNG
jgi:salicylate hydroxylase